MLGERLRALRQRRVLSQRELAKLAGVAYRTVQQVEAGEVTPHPSTIRKLAAALGVEPWELAQGEMETAA
jgi:transcriptional regulator with XRE-family HTH domain